MRRNSTSRETTALRSFRATAVALLAGLASAAVAGCHTPAETGPVPLRDAPPFSDSGAADLPDRWWTAFGEPALNEHVERAVGENFDLASAWQRLRAAQAIVDSASSALFPTVNAVASGELAGGDTQQGDQFQFGLEAAYEVDLWGRIDSLVEAERLRAEATYADYQTVGLTLSAAVARTWFQLVEARRQRDLLQSQIDTNEDVLQLLQNRVGIGAIRRPDLLRQRQLIEATREQLIVIESRIEVLEHALAVLEGRAPQEAAYVTDDTLPSLPPLPETGLPSDLVQRRPDVRAAYFLVEAANRDLAAAISNQYPRLSLSSAIATGAEDPSDLFGDWVRSIGASVLTPVFDAGRRAADIDQAQAVEQQLLYNYAQTVLTAFREVEDALIQEQKQLQRIQSLETQVQLAQETYEQLRVQYFNGIIEYISVLTALTDAQSLRRDLLAARRELLGYRVALYRALAGGFETGREPSSAEQTVPPLNSPENG